MKTGKPKTAALFLCALLAVVGLAGCKKNGADVEGAYKLPAPEEDKSYSVVFALNNPRKPLGNGLYETTAYVSLKGVYLKFRYIEDKSVSLRLQRCIRNEETGVVGTVLSYDAKVESKSSNYGVWYEPFDLSVTTIGNRAVETYNYYRIFSSEGECYLDEVVFVGEILKGQGSKEGTGEYCIIPATVFSADPQGSESEDRALRNARTLLDEQPTSVDEILK